MRIGIDARFYGPNESGISRYIERLLAYLQKIDQQNDYVVFLRQLASDWKPTNPRWRVVIADVPWYSISEQLKMPTIFLKENLDLLHVPHFNKPIFYPRRFVITVHDLILNEFPTERSSTLEPVIFWIKLTAYKLNLWLAAKFAKRIITVSQYSAQSVANKYPNTNNKIRVTYESVDPFPPIILTDTLADHGIHHPYIMYAGNTYPHKNLENLVAAIKIANNQGCQFQAVFIGKRDYFSLRLEKHIKEQGIKNIVFYGFATDSELHQLYKNAQAYFFPSLSEGFGLPGLEAMSIGTPVFAAQASCLPEVYGTAANYFDPHNINDISRAIKQSLTDQAENRRLIAAGYEQVKKYSWKTMAEKTKAIYQEAMST